LLGIITPKVQENITAVGKVTLHVWTSNWGQRPAAAAEALNKLVGRGTRAPRGSGPVSAWWDFIISSADYLEEQRKLPSGVWGGDPAAKTFLYAILCDFTPPQFWGPGVLPPGNL